MREDLNLLSSNLIKQGAEHSLPGEQLVPYHNGKKWGFCNADKKIAIEPRYDDAWAFSDGLALVELNGKYSFIDSDGREISEFKYNNARSFREGFARVLLRGWWSFIDCQGAEIIPFCYGADDFSNGLAMVNRNYKWGFINRTGEEIIPFKYDETEPFKNGFARVEFDHKHQQGAGGCGTMFLVSSKHGYIGRDGTEYFES